MSEQNKPQGGLDATAVIMLIISLTNNLTEDFHALEMISIDPELDYTARKAAMTQFADRIQERIATINMQTDRLQKMSAQMITSITPGN